MNVLVVEDNRPNSMLIRKLLSSVGPFNIDLVESGDKAVLQYRSKHYDLLVLDNYLPVYSGVEVLKLLRRELLTNNTYVIITTSEVNYNLTVLLRSGNYNLRDIQIKPIDLNRFTNCVAIIAAEKEHLDSILVNNKTEGSDKLVFCLIEFPDYTVLELRGRLTDENKWSVHDIMFRLETCLATQISIDIDPLEHVDLFTCETLVCLKFWCELRDKKALITCTNPKHREILANYSVFKFLEDYQQNN